MRINQKTASGYDLLYPETSAEMVLTSDGKTVAAHLADYAYQIPIIVDSQIRINKLSNTNRLFFKLDNNVSGNITISTDGGATELPLQDVDGNPITMLEKGFVEVVADANFFILRNRGLGGADKQALIDIVNEAEANESDLKQLFIDDINLKDENAELTRNSTWFEILNALSNMEIGKRKRNGLGVSNGSRRFTITGLDFLPTVIILENLDTPYITTYSRDINYNNGTTYVKYASLVQGNMSGFADVVISGNDVTLDVGVANANVEWWAYE